MSLSIGKDLAKLKQGGTISNLSAHSTILLSSSTNELEIQSRHRKSCRTPASPVEHQTTVVLVGLANNTLSPVKGPTPDDYSSLTFPEIVHKMVTNTAISNPNIIDWLHDGEAFVVKNPQSSGLKKVLQKYFRHNKYSSLQRQLNIYGWKKHTKDKYAGAFHHPMFHRDRGKPRYLRGIQRRTKIKRANMEQDDFANRVPQRIKKRPIREAALKSAPIDMDSDEENHSMKERSVDDGYSAPKKRLIPGSSSDKVMHPQSQGRGKVLRKAVASLIPTTATKIKAAKPTSSASRGRVLPTRGARRIARAWSSPVSSSRHPGVANNAGRAGGNLVTPFSPSFFSPSDNPGFVFSEFDKSVEEQWSPLIKDELVSTKSSRFVIYNGHTPFTPIENRAVTKSPKKTTIRRDPPPPPHPAESSSFRSPTYFAPPTLPLSKDSVTEPIPFLRGASSQMVAQIPPLQRGLSPTAASTLTPLPLLRQQTSSFSIGTANMLTNVLGASPQSSHSPLVPPSSFRQTVVSREGTLSTEA